MELGDIIKEIRKKKGLSQKDLAEKVEITPTYLSQIENNKRIPKLKTLKIISNQLEMPSEYLMIIALAKNEKIPPEKRQAYELLISTVKSMYERLFLDES